MLIQLSSHEQLNYQKTSLAMSLYAGASTPALRELPGAQSADQVQISDASRMALQSSVQQMDFSGGWTDMRFDLDSGIQATARYQLNVSQRQETLQLSFEFSAESLGISPKIFEKFGNQPLEFNLQFQQQSLDVTRDTQLTITQTNREAHEIIADIAKALRDVFMQPGDESVTLSLDKEAFQTLIGNARTNDLVDDVAALIGIINHLRLHGGARNNYHIFVSGKGNPKVDYHEELNVKIEGSSISIRITIQPPEQSDTETEASPQEPLPEAEPADPS